MRYTGFGPRLAARVLATRNVLWIPKITGSIFSALCFPCLGHESCCCSRLSEASHPPRHSALRYWFHVLWPPKVTGSIFAGLCFACLGHEACCCSRLSEASHRLLHGIRRCGILVSDPASQRGGQKKCFMDSKGNGKHFSGLCFWLA